MAQMIEKRKQNLKPRNMIRIFCPNCKEIMVKIYPNSTIFPQEAMQVPPCIACQNKGIRQIGRYDGPSGDRFPSPVKVLR